MTDYSLCGWRVRSAIPLPELAAWPDAPGEPEVEIMLGPLPETLPGGARGGPRMEFVAGQVLYTVRNLAAFLIEDGKRVTVATDRRPDSIEVRRFLLGSVFALLCHQRGVLPIHAAAVEIDGMAVAFAGSSGAGKSTLAAAFHRRGFHLLADDVTPIALDPVRLLPGLRRIRLWDDAAREADWCDDAIERVADGVEKFSRAFDDGFAATPLPPRALFHLSTGDTLGFRPLPGGEAMRALTRQTYRWKSLMSVTGRREATRRIWAAGDGIRHHIELVRPLGFDRLDATIDAIVAAVRKPG